MHAIIAAAQLELDVVIDLIQFVEAQQALAVLQVPKPQSKLSTLANEMGLLVESKRRQLQGVSANVKAHVQLLGRLRGRCATYVQHVTALQVCLVGVHVCWWSVCCVESAYIFVSFALMLCRLALLCRTLHSHILTPKRDWRVVYHEAAINAAAAARSGQLLEQRTGLHVDVGLALPQSHPLAALQRDLAEAASIPLLKVGAWDITFDNSACSV